MARIITKGLIGLEDLAIGTSTFTRATSVGGTQTLTQINNANLGGGEALLNQQGPSAAIVGTGGDATLFTYTIPPNTLGAGRGLRVIVCTIHTAGSASTTYKLTLGGSVLSTPTFAPANNGDADYFEYLIFNNTGVQNAQNYSVFAVENSSTEPAGTQKTIIGVGTSAVDMVMSQVIAFTFNVANTDQVTPKFWLVELI